MEVGTEVMAKNSLKLVLNYADGTTPPPNERKIEKVGMAASVFCKSWTTACKR